MKLNNKGYLIVEIIVASVLAMGIAYFLLELVVDLKNRNEDYFVNTLLETDKALMTREVMNDVSNYKIKSITSDNENFVEFVYAEEDNEFTKRITIDKDNKIFKYGIHNGVEYINDESYFEKKFDSNLNVTGVSITNKCFYNNSYVLCDDLDEETKKNVTDGLATISIDAKTIYSDYNYGVELNIKYKRAVTIIKEAYDLTINTTDINKFNNNGDYDVSVICANANARWDYTNWKLDVYGIKAPDTCNVSFTDRKENLAQYIINNAGTTQGNGQIVNEKGYRYEGENPNNYVLFNNELWRIIGVFDEETHGVSGQNLTKIIRNDSIGSFAWDKNNINNWSTSSLKTILNDYYYNKINGTGQDACYFHSTSVPGNCDFRRIGLEVDARNMIQSVTWKLGGFTSENATAEEFYEYERGTIVYSGRPTSTTGYIGLMYPSDYGYSVLASSCTRSTNLSSYNSSTCGGESWLLKNGNEWTMTPSSNAGPGVAIVSTIVYLIGYSAFDGSSVRPTAYLKSSVYIVSGDGTQINPYILGN